MSEQMKNAYNLAPHVAEALREVAAEADFPELPTEEYEWTERQKASRDFAVELAEAFIARDLNGVLADDLLAHAEAARDAAMDGEA